MSAIRPTGDHGFYLFVSTAPKKTMGPATSVEADQSPVQGFFRSDLTLGLTYACGSNTLNATPNRDY